MVMYRGISRDFFSDAQVALLTPLARLLVVTLGFEADREGRLVWDLPSFALRYFGRDSVSLESETEELVNRGFLRFYKADGRQLAWMPKFKDT